MGFIAGDLENQNPHVTRVPVFCGGNVVIAALADLAETSAPTEQLELQLASNAKSPPPAGAGGGLIMMMNCGEA